MGSQICKMFRTYGNSNIFRHLFVASFWKHFTIFTYGVPFFAYQNEDAFLSFTNLISPFLFSAVCSSEDWCGKQCRHTALIRKLFMWKFMITSLLQLALQKSDSRIIFSFYELNFMSPHLRKTGFSARCKQEMLTLQLRLQLNTNYHLPLCALLPDCKFRGKKYLCECGEKQNEIFGPNTYERKSFARLRFMNVPKE